MDTEINKYIHHWLEIWAAWQHKITSDSIGYPSHSSAYQMMQTAAPSDNPEYRRKKRVIVDVIDGKAVPRGTDPIPCREKRHGIAPRTLEPDIPAEMMDDAVNHLRSELKKLIITRYLDDSSRNMALAARALRMGETKYRMMQQCAYESIDTYMRLEYPHSYADIKATITSASNI